MHWFFGDDQPVRLHAVQLSVYGRWNRHASKSQCIRLHHQLLSTWWIHTSRRRSSRPVTDAVKPDSPYIHRKTNTDSPVSFLVLYDRN